MEVAVGAHVVLYSAYQPREETALDCQQDEYELIRIMSRAGGVQDRVAWFGRDLRSFEGLRVRVTQFDRPVVHLTGHGAVRDVEDVFLFGDERGHRAPGSARELVLDALVPSRSSRWTKGRTVRE